MDNVKTLANAAFIKSRSMTGMIDKLYLDLYGELTTSIEKNYYLGISIEIPYVKDVVFTTTTTAAVYDGEGVLITPASTTTTADKVMGSLIFEDGVLTSQS